MAYPHETDDAGVVTTKNVNANQQAGDPVEAVAVTGREPDQAPDNTTFADRKAMSSSRVENKAVGGFDAMTKDELVAEAERRGVEVASSWKKADIVAALEGA